MVWFDLVQDQISRQLGERGDEDKLRCWIF
jgi:hypothetical protein